MTAIVETLTRLGERRPVRQRAGFYLLLRAGHIVYVGASKNVDARVQAHVTVPPDKHRRLFVFDSAIVVETTYQDAWRYERALIYALLPEYNTFVLGIGSQERLILAKLGVSVVDEQASERAAAEQRKSRSRVMKRVYSDGRVVALRRRIRSARLGPSESA